MIMNWKTFLCQCYMAHALHGEQLVEILPEHGDI